MKLQQLICALMLGAASLTLGAAEREIDRVAAIVDNGVVLKSDIDEIVERVKRNARRRDKPCHQIRPCVPRPQNA